MERCLYFHRLVAIAFCCLCLCAGVRGRQSQTISASTQPVPMRVAQAPQVSSKARFAQPLIRQQAKNVEYKLSQDRYEKAVAYSRASYAMYFAAFFLSVLALVAILRLGIAAKFRDWAENVSDKRRVQALVFVPLIVVSAELVMLPLRLYGHVLSLRYEMSVQGWESWFGDWAKEEFLMVGIALLFALMLSAAMRWSPRRWWLLFWCATLPVVLFIVFISPWLLDPMFNKFEPLQATHPELVAAIEKLTVHAGVPIPADRIFLMRASEKTNAIDAYVTGVGASKRVVIWDTTIQKATTDETLFIVGHELGHYVLGHVWKGFMFAAVLLLIGFYALFRALHWALGRWGADWRIYGAEDWAAFAVVLLLIEVGMFLVSPISNGFSRMQEHAADVYGLEVTHGIIPDSAEVAAQSFQVLGEVDLADPNPSEFITIWLYSHPPLADRLVFAHNYDPWSKGEPPKYVK
jgi:STE24 endopeptidase